LYYNHFPKDTYDTPQDTPRFLSDRLSFNTRAAFVAKFVRILFQARKIASKGDYNTKEWIKSSIDIVKMIEGCGGRFHIKGLDNIHKDSDPVVFISNHMSTLETMVFPGIIAPTRPVTFVVKDSLVTHPIFGPIMRAREPIVVSRKNSREDLKTVLNRGKELLRQGISIIIFPQSTRSVEFKEKEFNSLGVKLAARANAKVIPIAIKTNFWGNGNIIKDIGPIVRSRGIYITFGEPFTINGSGKEEHQQIVDFIKENLKKWQD
jgi:1-acyl-sn-glycerol-3-phosphate acyltransferase